MSKNSRRNKAKFEAEAFEAGLADAVKENRVPTVEEAAAAVNAGTAGKPLPAKAVEAFAKITCLTAEFAVKIRDQMIAAGMDPVMADTAVAAMAAEFKKAEKAEEAPAVAEERAEDAAIKAAKNAAKKAAKAEKKAEKKAGRGASWLAPARAAFAEREQKLAEMRRALLSV